MSLRRLLFVESNQELVLKRTNEQSQFWDTCPLSVLLLVMEMGKWVKVYASGDESQRQFQPSNGYNNKDKCPTSYLMVLFLFLAMLQVLQDLFPAQESYPSLKAWNPNPWTTREFPYPTAFDTLVYLVLLMKKFSTCLIAHDNKDPLITTETKFERLLSSWESPQEGQ